MKPEVSQIANNLLRNIAGRGCVGFDPYDVRGLPFMLSLIRWGNRSRFGELLREIVLELITQYPHATRRLLRVEPSVNAKALGLIGTACAELSLLETVDNELLQATTRLCDRLLQERRVLLGNGTGWGYPFDWQSAQLIRAETPNGVVSTAVGEYFWTRFQITRNPADLEPCVGIARFLFSLPVAETVDGKLCFSYFPHYQNYIHNLNLLVADYLIKVGGEAGEARWVERAHRAVDYTLAAQREDGSFDYNGPPEAPVNMVDSHHTGFVLRMLGSIAHHSERQDILPALDAGLRFYLENFFTAEGAPRARWNRTYGIDIHAAAEALNCLPFLSMYHEDAVPVAERVLAWTLDNLYDPQAGDFYYGILKSRFTGRVYLSRIKYMRWNQAWMLRGLSRYLLYRDTGKVIV